MRPDNNKTYKYQITVDGKTYDVSKDNIDKYGWDGYADDYPGATVRMRNDDGEDYDVPLGRVDAMTKAGLHPFKTSYTQPVQSSKAVISRQAGQAPNLDKTVQPWQPTMQQRLQMNATAQGTILSGKQTLDEADARMANIREYGSGLAPSSAVASDYRLNPKSGKIEKTYVTPTGERTFDRAAADAVSRAYHDAVDMTLSGQLRRAVKLRDDISRRLAERGRELQDEYDKKSVFQKMVASMQYAEGGYHDNALGTTKDDEYTKLMAALRQADLQVKELSRQQRREADKQGFWRATGEILTDPYTYAHSARLGDMVAQASAKSGASEADDLLLEASYGNLQAQAKYGDNASFLERAGVMTGYMPSFMVDFMATGGGFSGINFITKATGKAATKALGKEVIEEMAKQGFKNYVKRNGLRGLGNEAANWTIKALGTTADDLLIRAPLMTNTVQAASTAADIIERKLGEVTVDDSGNYDFTNDKTWGSAIWQGEANSIVENYSEMFGAHLPDVASMKNLGKLANVIGAKRLGDVLAKADAGALGGITDGTRRIFQQMGVNDYLGEVSEEYYGQLWRTMLNLDDAYRQNPDGTRTNLFATGQFHGDIWGGMALSMGLMGAGKTTMSAANYLSMKHDVNKADARASELLTPEVWEPLRSTIDMATNDNVGDVAEVIVNDQDMTDEEKAAVMNYMERSLYLRGVNLAELVKSRGGEQDENAQRANDSYMDGYNAQSDVEMQDARSMYELQRQKAEQALPPEQLAVIDEDPMGALQNLGDDQATNQTIIDYINAKQVYDGMIQRVRDDIDGRIDQSNAMIDSRTNRTTGMIQGATMKVQDEEGNDRRVYVLDGNLAIYEDGTGIDHENSDGSIIIRDAESGKIEMVSPDAIFSVEQPVEPETEKQTAAEAIRQQFAQEAASRIDGVVPFNPGDTYTVTDESGQTAQMQIVPNADGLVDNGDGTVNVSSDGGQTVVPMRKEDIQAMVDATNRARVEQAEQKRETMKPQARPTYNLNDEITLLDENGNIVRGSITSDIDEDGQYEVYTETPINGWKVNLFTEEQLERMRADRRRYDEMLQTVDNQPRLGQQTATAEPQLVGRSLTEKESATLIAEMEAQAETAPEMELTPANWQREFGADGMVDTPLGKVKMGENQITKLFAKGRDAQFGMIRPTLADPDVIIEESSTSSDGTTERPSSYVFVKTFNRNGETIKFFASITVKKDGMEVSVSSHFMNKNAVARKMVDGNVMYIKEALRPISSEWHLAEHREDVPDLLPTQENNASITEDTTSTGKDTTPSGKKQGGVATSPIPRDSQGQPDYERADPDAAWDAIVEQTGGDEAMAQAVADSMMADKEAALKKAERAKPRGGVTIAEKIAAERDRKEAVERAKASLTHWQRIALTRQRRQMEAQAEQSRRAEEAARSRREQEERQRAELEEAERIRREALNGVPDIIDDTPQDARARGYRRVNGEKIDRQAPLALPGDVSADAVNRQFNDELQRQVDGTLPKGHIYRLGRPGGVLLSTGFPDLPIELSSTRLEEKARQRNHEFDIADVRDLAKAINNPLAVFSYGNKDKAQNVVVEIERGGKKFVVGISLNPVIGGRNLEVNSIRGLFPKDNAEWLNWIAQGKLLYVDKQKIQALMSQQRTILADVGYLDLDAVANIVENFENPDISIGNGAILGNEVHVKFDDQNIPAGRVALIEASRLQPSHINGQRNPLHFIDEAQPKERNDEASVLSARRMAANIRPEEITSSVTAYTGAPTVNVRGEVIQGNNRSAALREMWAGEPAQAQKYRQYLTDHAADFGLTPEDVEAMRRPVLVSMVDVSDDDAITLGQFVAQDTESGGTERIKPRNVVQRMGGDMRSFASRLLSSSNDEMTFSELVDRNGMDVLKWMQQRGHISPTQYRSAFDNRGNLTAEAKNDLRGIMYQSIFQNGNTHLEEMFGTLPAKAQKAILATAYRDYDSPNAERMNAELQASISAYHALSQMPDFASAKNYREARLAAQTWQRQYAIDDVTGESYLPSDRYSNFAVLLAVMYKGQTQSFIQNTLDGIFDLVQGTQEATLFEQPDNTPRTLVKAINEAINARGDELLLNGKFTYDGQRRSNVLAGGSAASQQGRQGSTGDAPAGGRAEDATRQTDSPSGVERNGGQLRNDGKRQNALSEVSSAERAEMENRIVDWLSDGNLAKASGKSREYIFKEFGNEPMPIAYIPERFMPLVGAGISDPRIYCGKGYFIEHALRNHAAQGNQISVDDVDVSKYLNIQSVLDNPDHIKETFVDGKRTVVFIKKIGRYFAELTQVEENGKIILHKSLFNQKKEPYAKLDDIRHKDTSSEGGVSSISHADGAAPAISLQSRDDEVSKVSVWKHADDVSTASDVADGLYSTQGNMSDPATKGTDAPQTNISVRNGTDKSGVTQTIVEKVAKTEEETEQREAELASRVQVNDDDWQDGDGERPTYKRSIIIDGTHTATQIDEPDENGHYTGSYFELDNKRFGDIAEIVDYIDNGNTLASKIEQAEAETDANPTEAQKEAGNYKKGHVRIGQFNITVENPKGSVRRGTDANGNRWETTMRNTYGYIRGTEGVDGDHIDVFLTNDIDGWNGRRVYVVDQYNEDGTFDEHKVMLGFNEEDEARDAYFSNYSKGWSDRHKIVMTSTNLEDFEKWIDSSHRKTKPFAEYRIVNVEQSKSISPADRIAEIDRRMAELKEEADAAHRRSDLFEEARVINENNELYAERRRLVQEMQPSAVQAEDENAGQTQRPSATDDRYTIERRYHKKNGSYIHAVKFTEQMPREQFLSLKKRVKDFGGYYSSYGKGGFIFETEEAGRKFAEAVLDPSGEKLDDEKPLSLDDMRQSNRPAMHQVDVEGLMQAINRDGEAKLSDHFIVGKPGLTERLSGGNTNGQTSNTEAGQANDTYGADNRLVSRARYEELKKRMRQKLGGQMNMGIDPEILAIGTEMAAYHIEAGARRFADYARRMIADLGDAIRPYLKSFYNGARDLPEVQEAGYAEEMTPYDEVRTFDTANFDKTSTDALATAETVVAEQEIRKQAEKAKSEIINRRNNERRKEDEQTAADTEAVAGQAEAVADEAERRIENATDEKQVNETVEEIDRQLDKVNEQLALLGYYEADQVEGDFNEAYGYMRNAEKKAVKDANRLANSLVKDIGIDPKAIVDKKGKRRRSIATANIASIGGDISIHLPLGDKRELYINIQLDKHDGDNLKAMGGYIRIENPNPERGEERYLSSNNFFAEDETYQSLLRTAQQLVKHYAPDFVPVSNAQQEAPTKTERKQGKRQRKQEDPKIADLFSAFEEENRTESQDNSPFQKGDAVIYHGKPATVYDFDDDGRLVLDTGLAPVLYDIADPKEVKPANTVSPNVENAEINRTFANAVKTDMLVALDSGTRPYRSILDLRKRAAGLGMEVDNDGRTDILLQELVEDGLVRAAREVVKQHGRDSRESYDLICKLYDMQPTIAARSSNRIKMQQYSTPLPMAWNAAHFAMSGKKDGKVLEPTAGNGMLVFSVPAQQVHANELDETRLDNLREQGFAQVTRQDAAEPFEGGQQYDVIIANPPFGKREEVEYDGKMIPGLDPQITLNALASMKDDGKAAIIIGGNMEYGNNGGLKSMKPFFTYLYDHYNVKGVVDMDGRLYAKQGTTYPTRMILIDGRRSDEERAQTAVYPPVESKAILKAESFDDLYEIVNEVINSKEKTNGTEILRSQQGQLVSVADRPSRNTDGKRHTGQSRTDDTSGRGRRASVEGTQEQGEVVLRGEHRTDTGDGETRRGTGGNTTGGSRGVPEPDVQRVDRVGVSTNRVGLSPEPKKRNLTEEKLPYRPHNSAFSLESVAPAAMVEAMDNVLSQIEAGNGNIDEFVKKELGYDTIEETHQALAAEQIDSVAMAIYQMKKGQALIIGDQTGVGKGRQMAALIRWAVKRGEKPIFITQKADLFSDIYRDLVDIGSGDLVPFIFNSPSAKENKGEMVDANGKVVYKGLSDAKMKKVMATGKLPDEYDYAVLTYSQVNSGDEISQKEAEEAAKKRGGRTKKSKASKDGKATPKATFLRAIAEDNYLFLDESHTAAGTSNTGAYLQSILRSAKAATFASATFAKRPDTMPLYAIRTAMSQAKVEPDKLIGIIEKGGVTLQEIMSRELTNAGQMVRRERDMSDVVTDWKTITDPVTVKRSRENYDRTIAAFNAIIKFQEDYVKPMVDAMDKELAVMAESAGIKRGTDKLGISNVPFASKTYNYTKQLMLALKVDAIANEVDTEIKAGRHPVIALESTMESSIKDYSAGEVIEEPTFSASLLRGLDTVMQYTIKDENGKEQHARYSPKQLGEAGEKAYYELQDFIRKSTSDIFISPLDAIIERLHGIGYKVGELTGRDMYVERDDEGRVVVKRRTDKDKKKIQREFNNGTLDVLILNKSASTGISLHASEKFSDQRQRTMIIAQPLSDINDYMQMIGRIDRTGQVHRGYYINLGLPVPAENRFLMMLSTKLKSLNANTTTSQDSESNDVEAPDLLNKYGSQVVVEYLRDNPEIYEKMGSPLKKSGEGSNTVSIAELEEYKPQEDDARKITGYVALLTTKEQEEFYDDVVRRYNELIKYLNDTGSNDLKITVMPLRAKTLSKRVSSEGIDPTGTNPFARNSYVERVEMDVLRKPMKAAEIRKTIAQVNKGKRPEDYIRQVIATIEKEDEARVAAEEARYERSKVKAQEDIAKQTDKINRQQKRTAEEKQAAIADYVRETNDNVESKHNDNMVRINTNSDMLKQRLHMFEVGKSYLMPDNLESMVFDFSTPAIFCGYKSKDSKITASTTLAVFATLDGRRRMEVKLSQPEALRNIYKATNDNWDAARSTTLENWDSQIPTGTRKTGFIMTGNILQAIADTQDEHGGYPGQLISYTDIDGNVHDGILMPDKWNTSMLKTSGAPIISRLKQIKDYMPVTSHDGKVDITGSSWAKVYYLTVPKTKKDGAVYYENKTLLDAVHGHNFYPYRGKLRADITAENIERVVRELSKLGVRIKEETNEDDALYRLDDELGEVNERFNEELRRYDSGEMDTNEMFHLGMPQGVMRAFLPDLPIVMRQRVAKKGAEKKHNVPTSALQDMPSMISDPIFVFQRDANTIGILTDMTDNDGKNVCVAIELGRVIQNGGEYLEVNDIRSFHGREVKYIIEPIAHNNTLRYANKEKGLAWLSSASQPVQQEIDKQDLINAANIVRNFENPSFNGDNLREGVGELSDDDMSIANDPVSKLLGKSTRTAAQRRAFAERERLRMVDAVQELAAKLHLDNVEVVTDATTLDGRRAKAKGFYSRGTGRITIVIPNHTSVYDVEQTLLHEAVAHYGLRQLFGEHFDTFLDNVFQNADNDVRRRITELARERNWDFRTATEEYLASLAENTNFDNTDASWWQKIKELFLRMLHKIGFEDFSGVTLSDNELRYILWRSYENLAEPGRYRSILGEAEDVVMQSRLKVGNYAEAAETMTSAAEPAPAQDDGDKVARIEKLRQSEPIVVSGNDYQGKYELNPKSATRFILDNLRGDYVNKDTGNTIRISRKGAEKVMKHDVESEAHLKSVAYIPQMIENAIFIAEETNTKGKTGFDSYRYYVVGLNMGSVDYTVKMAIGVKDGETYYDHALTQIEKSSLLDGIDPINTGFADKEAARMADYSSIKDKRLLSILQTNSAKTDDSDTLFREGDPEVHERTLARDRYEQRVKRGVYQTQEALQDSMLGLREAMEAILKGEGKKKVRIEDVDGFENAYLGENRLSSVNKAEADAFAHTLFKPLLDEVGKLAPTKEAREELTDYMMAKHGLERNSVMRQREKDKLIDASELSKNKPQPPTENDDDYDLKMDAYNKAVEDWNNQVEKELGDKFDAIDKRDFAGLTALTDTDNVADAEAEARQMVEDYESGHDTDTLWKRVNAVSDAILSKLYENGMMSKATYDNIRSMYDYYIPLRGFDEKTGEEEYAYLNSKNSAFNAPIKTAKGRKSKADDPFAYLQSMAESAIVQGNRNKLVKQKFLNFVLNHPSDLASVSDIWLKYDKVSDEWQPVFPDNINVDDTPSEVERKMQDFEDKMKELSEQDPDLYKHGKDTVNIPYRVVEKRDLRQHQVVVKRGGRDYVVTINGNPRATQALNGQTNPDNDMSGAVGAILKAGERINRELSALYTTRNPDFVVSNFIRDMLYSNSMVWIKESPNYAMRFHRNFAKVNPVRMKMLLAKYRKNELDMSNGTERMFHQFMMNGGETGYSNMRDIEKHKNDIRREIRKAGGQLPIRKAWDLLAERLDEVNRGVENCARFAAFMTSREMDRTIDRSIYDAKEISVNFNKKGSGAKFMGATGQTKLGNSSAFMSGLGRSGFVFWNAAIQGTANFGRQAKRHPAKALTSVAVMFLLGAIVASLGYGDDDEDDKNSYWNLPEYVRRSNLLFRAGDQWISIPLPVEYRAVYGLGELMVSTLSGKEYFTDGELASKIAGQVSQLLPLDFMEGGGGFKAFIPSSIKPFAEAYGYKKSWTGLPIYKDTPYNKDMPEWTKAYKSANKYLVDLSETLNEMSGGDQYTKGAIDINPAKVEYVLNGYFGGIANTIDKLTKMGETMIGQREYDPKSFLVLNRILKNGDERTEYKAVNNEYFRLKEEHDKLRTRLRNYERDTENGVFDYAEKIDFLYNSPEYARYEIFENYRPDIDDLYDMLNDAYTYGDKEAVKDIETQLNELKKMMISDMNKARK